MMGGSRGTDQRLEQAGQTIAILEVLANPDGLKKAAAELKATRAEILQDIAAEEAKAKVQHDALGEKAAALEARELALTANEKAWEAKEVALAGKAENVTRVTAEFGARAAALDATAAGHDKRQQELDEQAARLVREQAARAKELDSAHQARLAELDRVATAQAVAEAKFHTREVAVESQEKALKARAAELDNRDAALKIANQEAAALQADYEQKLAQLRTIVTVA